MRHTICAFVFVALLMVFTSCSHSERPLDANTRQAIDSISSVQITLARKEMDSLCQQRRLTELPRIVDSIKQKRLMEIERQLKTIPK